MTSLSLSLSVTLSHTRAHTLVLMGSIRDVYESLKDLFYPFHSYWCSRLRKRDADTFRRIHFQSTIYTLPEGFQNHLFFILVHFKQ